MTRKIMRRVSWPIVFGALAAPFVVNCGALPKGMPGGLGGKCPDMANVDDIEKFDFAGEFKLKADVAANIKAAAEAGAEIKSFAAKMDSDLTGACGALAKDLGDTNTYTNAKDACNAASTAIGTFKAKLGASASIKVDMSPPHCGVDINAYGDCAAHCDATFKPGDLEAQCKGGDISGSCSAQCSGECEMKAAASCSGECSGSCDASVSGTCSGTCSGKCDGKVMNASANGQCSGKCDGKCSGSVKGTCSGKCGGSCKMSAGASCSGQCTGHCSAKWTAPQCTGKMDPPKISANCKAKCDAKVQANASCTPPHFAIAITGAADANASAQFEAALTKDLPVIVQYAIGMKDQVAGLKDEVSAVVNGVVSGAASASADPMTGGRLVACLSPLKGAADAAASVSVNVSVSASVSGKAGVGG